MRLKPSLVALFLFCTATLAHSLPNDNRATQRDWMSGLVDALRYGYGLPDKPVDADYENILDGRREYRVEPEDCLGPEDLVAINSFKSFGPFTGSGWVCGLSNPSTIHLKFNLMHSGTYRVFATVRLPGHTLKIGDKILRIDRAGSDFVRVEAGEVFLNAGEQSLQVDLPANGSIDSVELIASALPLIAPLAGWKPDAPLTPEVMAVTVIRALSLEELLPPSAKALPHEAESESAFSPFVTDQRHLGEPSGGKWLRAGSQGGTVVMHLHPPRSGAYQLWLRAAADAPISGNVNQRNHWKLDFPPYLETKLLGVWYFAAAEQTVTLDLPPRGGVDALILKPLRAEQADYRVLAGLTAADAIPSAGVTDRLLTLLTRLLPAE